MEKIVKGCDDCPLKCNDFSGNIVCFHPDQFERTSPVVNPEWCPLKKDPITITLIKNEVPSLD